MHLRHLALTLSLALPFALAGCSSSENLSSKGQLIECEVDANGAATNCTPVDQPSGAADSCIDKDEDGDGDAHDSEAEDDDDHASATGDDDDGDGMTNGEDDDDDNDGIDDEDDCDELPGGDSDDGV
jgi:hypothetical protein